MSLDTFSSRAPSLPMPMTHSSARWPVVSAMGAPWRSSSWAKAVWQAASNATSASQVMGWTTSDSGAACSQSSTVRRSMTNWRRMRSAAPVSCPRALSVAKQAAMVACVGTPGASSGNSSG